MGILWFDENDFLRPLDNFKRPIIP